MDKKLEKAFAKIGLEFEALSLYPMTWNIYESEKVDTMGTDFRNLYYSPSFVDQVSLEELIAVVLHEVFHCVFLHPELVDRGMSRNRNRFVWTLALEQVVNAEVVEVIANTQYRLPGKPIDPIKIVSGKLEISERGYVYSSDLAGKNEVEVYEILMKNYEPGSENAVLPEQIALVGDVIPQQKMSSEDKQNAVEKAVATIKRLQKTGKVTANLERFLKDLIQPRVPWQRILQQFVSQVVDGHEEFSFTKPNIRRQPIKDVVIPATQQTRIDEPVVVFDTSGSIDDDTIRRFASELYRLFKDVVENITIITTDNKVNEIVKVNSIKEVMQKVKFRGGGGTDFRPLFERVKKCEFMIFFTDGYADYPEKAPAYPVLWVLTKDHKKPPFGKVAYIYED